MSVEDIYTIKEFKDEPIRRVGLGYEIVVLPPREEVARQIFGNDLGFNSIRIVVKDKIPVLWSGVGPKISHVLPHGIVISCDSAEMGETEDDGFHNFFVPWSQIVYIYQYIAT